MLSGRMIGGLIGSTLTSPVGSFASLLSLFFYNIYVRFGSFVSAQVVGIPIGTNSAPLLADLSFSSHLGV